MKLKMYSALDDKTKTWAAPFYARHPGEAARILEEVCNKPDSQFCKHAEDFRFFEVGEWDDETGVVTPSPIPTPIGTAVQYKKLADRLDKANNLAMVQ